MYISIHIYIHTLPCLAKTIIPYIGKNEGVLLLSKRRYLQWTPSGPAFTNYTQIILKPSKSFTSQRNWVFQDLSKLSKWRELKERAKTLTVPGQSPRVSSHRPTCTPSSSGYSSFMPHCSALNIGSRIIVAVVLTGNYRLPLFIFSWAAATQRHGLFHLPSHMGDWLPISCPHCKRITIPRQHWQCC